MSITVWIIIITVMVSVTAFYNRHLMWLLRFHPVGMMGGKDWYRFFSYALIHGDWIHLAVNMYVLYSFGSNNTEFMYKFAFPAKGAFYYIILYIGGVCTSVIPAFEKNKNNPDYSAVGASGAVSAVVFASILFNPRAQFMLMFIPFPIPAYIFGILYLVFSYIMAKRNADNIGHDAHFFGALFGIMFTIILDKNIAVNFYKLVLNAWI